MGIRMPPHRWSDRGRDPVVKVPSMKKIPEMSEKDKTRFWAKVNKNGSVVRTGLGPCWEWTGAKDRYGRGHLSIKDINYVAPRLSWKIETGDDPFPNLVCHKCDNPTCVRPDHLFVGSHLDNNKDKKSKGRSRSSDRVKNQSGEKNFRAKLTEADVLEIRRLYDQEKATYSYLSKRYGVAQSSIWQVVKRKNWIHI